MSSVEKTIVHALLVSHNRLSHVSCILQLQIFHILYEIVHNENWRAEGTKKNFIFFLRLKMDNVPQSSDILLSDFI